MKRRGPLPGVVAAVLTVAMLGTLLADAGWVLWPPALLALAVVCLVARMPWMKGRK